MPMSQLDRYASGQHRDDSPSIEDYTDTQAVRDFADMLHTRHSERSGSDSTHEERPTK